MARGAIIPAALTPVREFLPQKKGISQLSLTCNSQLRMLIGKRKEGLFLLLLLHIFFFNFSFFVFFFLLPRLLSGCLRSMLSLCLTLIYREGSQISIPSLSLSVADPAPQQGTGRQ